MLCEERGFFLEIADIIRGLGLTILKGVMEARNDKIWARFAVEVILKSFWASLHFTVNPSIIFQTANDFILVMFLLVGK